MPYFDSSGWFLIEKTTILTNSCCLYVQPTFGDVQPTFGDLSVLYIVQQLGAGDASEPNGAPRHLLD